MEKDAIEGKGLHRGVFLWGVHKMYTRVAQRSWRQRTFCRHIYRYDISGYVCYIYNWELGDNGLIFS